jgi:translation initiation factor 2 subunit 1
LRHVASKIASVGGSSEATASEGGTAAAPVASEPEQQKENKRAARKARQAAQDEGAEVEHDIPGGANEDEKLEQLHDQIAWPLGKKYGHPYDAFKLALT